MVVHGLSALSSRGSLKYDGECESHAALLTIKNRRKRESQIFGKL